LVRIQALFLAEVVIGSKTHLVEQIMSATLEKILEFAMHELIGEGQKYDIYFPYLYHTWETVILI
jgi:IS30 family transposase